HFTVDQGLPVPTVTALAQDGAGFIWVGTQGGLARFDGYRFKTFKPDPGNLAALPDSYVWTLHTDVAGRLWIGTIAGGLARVEDEHFIVYTPKRGGLSGISVRAIEDDGAGGIWVATEGGLDHLNAAGEILPRPKADVARTYLKTGSGEAQPRRGSVEERSLQLVNEHRDGAATPDQPGRD